MKDQLPDYDAMKWVVSLAAEDLREVYAEALDVLTGDDDPDKCPGLFATSYELDVDGLELSWAVMLEAAGRWANGHDDRNV